jgi:hypothetical protein
MDYNARYYDPGLGRFVSADTVVPKAGNPQALNRYSYAVGNPLRFVDPSGHWACEDEDCSLKPSIERIVKQYSSTYGVPWQVTAGVLKSEVELDTEPKDTAENAWYRAAPYPTAGVPGTLAPKRLGDPGPGIGNVHVSTAKRVSEYFATNYPDDPEMQLNLPKNKWYVARLLTVRDINIKVATAYVRMMADYRFGSNGQPLTVDHSDLSSWRIKDAAAIWHGYRYGVPTVSPDGQGFEALADFQDRSYGVVGLVEVATGEDKERSIYGSLQYLGYYFSRLD